MRKFMQVPILMLLLLFCTQETEPTIIDVADLIPGDGEISGWLRNGAMEVAENETQLWDLINGAGIVFIDHGFVKCAFQELTGDVQGSQSTVAVRAFDMGDTTNAYAVYHDTFLETGSEIPWTETGHAGVEARYELLVGYYMIEFWHDRFYVDITINNATSEAQNVAKFFAQNVSAAISAATNNLE